MLPHGPLPPWFPELTGGADHGALRWAPTEAQGPGEYTVTVCGSGTPALSDSETFAVTVRGNRGLRDLRRALPTQPWWPSPPIPPTRP